MRQQLTVRWMKQQNPLTSNDSIVGSLDNGAVKLDDVTVAEDAEDFSLSGRHTRAKQWQLDDNKAKRLQIY